MKITWFDGADLEGRNGSREDRPVVRSWVKKNEEELHRIYHYAHADEIEAIKIIAGDQEVAKDGSITMRTLELHLIRGLILILKSVEVQTPGSYTARRAVTQLGYIVMPDCEDDCDCLPATKKEIK